MDSPCRTCQGASAVSRELPYAHAPRLPLDGLSEGETLAPWHLFAPSGGKKTASAERGGPIELEIGPGRGWFLFERLEAAPEVRILGLEIRRKWATIVDERLRRRGLGSRARVFAEDAKLVLPRLATASLAVVYIHFPDPWWKKRHHKRLVVTPELLTELGRVLVDYGELLIQTDVEERANQYEALVARCPEFVPLKSTARVEDHAYGARSPRERRAMEDGLPVYRLLYRRQSRAGQARAVESSGSPVPSSPSPEFPNGAR